MDCDPNALMAAAKCFRCIPKGMINEVRTYLMCQWVNRPASGPTCVSAVVDDWATRVVANGGTAPTAAQKLACCTFVNGLQSAGILNDMISVGVFVPGATSPATTAGELKRALTPLIKNAGADPWGNVGPFVPGDLTLDGLIGNGAKWLGTGITWAGPLDNIGLSAYSITVGNDGKASIGTGSGAGPAICALYIDSATGNSEFYSWGVTSGTNKAQAANSNWAGFVSGNHRPTTPNYGLYKGNNTSGFSALTTFDGGGGILSGDQLGVFARVLGGGGVDISSKRHSFAAIHNGLRQAQVSNLYSLVRQLRIDLGGGYV